jgi:hypothetical protein
MDRLAPFFEQFTLSARMFHSGAFCGSMRPMRADVKEKFFPLPLPKGAGCGDLHPARSQIWRGSGFATCSRQTKAVGGFYSTVS